MKLYRLISWLLLGAAAGCGDPGAPRYAGTTPPVASAFGACAFCHDPESSAMLPVAASLNCVVCHVDARPGFAGKGHRTIPAVSLVPSFPPSGHRLGDEAALGACAYCHHQTAADILVFADRLQCETCHTASLSPNFGPNHRSLPDAAIVPASPSPPHVLGREEQQWGNCGLCHYSASKAMADRFGAPGELTCATCHVEQAVGRFGPGHYDLPGTARVPSAAPRGHQPGQEAQWGSCAFCHNAEARALETVLGSPVELACSTCHEDRTPGRFGAGHRGRPDRSLVPDAPRDPHRPLPDAAASGSCAFCHAGFANNIASVVGELACTTCHREQLAGQYGPGHRERTNPDLVPAFVGADHKLGALRPFGACAFCHRDIGENVVASDAGDLGCMLCHEKRLAEFGPGHRSLPSAALVPSFVGVRHDSGPARTFGTCAFCHRSTTNRALEFTHGRLEVSCELCHAEATSERFGPGHQSIVSCIACHGTDRKTHQDPNQGTAYECAVCHEPHGSENLFLIREQLTTPSGRTAPVRLDNLRGVADGGFAGASTPGTGLCEVCHTNTRFFRSDGTGEPHLTFPCFTCHPHALGFSVRP